MLVGCLRTDVVAASGLMSRKWILTLTSPLLADRAVRTLLSGEKPDGPAPAGWSRAGATTSGEKIAAFSPLVAFSPLAGAGALGGSAARACASFSRACCRARSCALRQASERSLRNVSGSHSASNQQTAPY